MRKLILKVNYFALFFAVVLFNFSEAKGNIVMDQHWERPDPYLYGGSSHSIYFNSPIGQEFTPTRNNIVGVALAISADYLNMKDGEIQPMTVNICDDVINGNVIANANLSPAVDDAFIENLSNEPYFVWLYFDFGEVVPITVDHRYVIKVSVPELGALNWIWKGWEDTYNIGIPGQRIIMGVRSENEYSPSSFGFRTYAIPEPSTLLLLCLGALFLRRKCR